MSKPDKKDVISAMEGIVSKKYVSGETYLTDNYAYNWNADNLTEGKSKFVHKPICVVLPEKTEEIVKIVQYCNDQGLQFKAQSTGWGVHNSVGKEEGVILLDCRRMDKILSIDTKNMIAVVEPYVSGAMLQVELLKLGLNCHIQGCGSNGSQLVTVTSMVGQGWTGISTGFSNRNILGAEWVMPEGKVCRIGAWGSFESNSAPDERIDASKWFLADGPGPSIRGVYRGYFGAFGGLGVFTKAAIKLYHWAGPPTLEFVGKTPVYQLRRNRLPPHIAVYFINWTDWEDFKDGGNLLAQSEVCWALCRLAGFDVTAVAAPSNTEFYNSPVFDEIRKELKYDLMVTIMANNKQEFEYQKKIIDMIVEKTNGEINQLTQGKPLQSLSFLSIVKQCNTMRGVFRLGGGFFTSLGALGSWDWCVEGAKIGEKLKQRYIDSGGLVDDGADNVWGNPYEQGTFGHLEELYMYDITDPESRKASVDYLKSVVEASKEHPLGLGLGTVDGEGSEMHNIFGPIACNYHKWLKAIKKEFDPKTASDPGFYIDPASVKE